MAMNQSTCQIEGVDPVPVQQPRAGTSAGHTAVDVLEVPQISETGHGRLRTRPENNTGRLCVFFPLLQLLNLLWFFVCFNLLQRSSFDGAHLGGVRPVPVQQPMELVPPEHAVLDVEAQISEQGNGPLGFLVLMFRSLASFALGQNRSNPFWRLILLTSVSLVVAAMIGLVYLPKALQEVHETYQRVMLTMTVVVPIVVAMKTFLATIWIAQDRDGRSNWITGLSVANVTMLGGPLVLYWAHTTYYTGN